MTVEEFVRSIPSFAVKNHPERIKAFGWFLHTKRNVVGFTTGDMTKCYRDSNLDEPANMGRFLNSLAEKKSPQLLEGVDATFAQAHAVREQSLDRDIGEGRDGDHQRRKCLTDLPGKITSTKASAYF